MDDKKAELKEMLKIEQKQKRVSAIEEMMKETDFWVDREKNVAILQELESLQKAIKRWDEAKSDDQLNELQFQAVMTGEHDFADAIITLSAGAGGTEAQDWAQMLMRMYQRWAERKGFKTEILSLSEGEEAGIKSATLKIVGPYTYGYLRTEDGVHRLVRLSPFDADHARHTSFASVEVIPEIKDLKEVNIDAKEIKIDVFRSSGKGGQSVNTTDSAVRITHLPTGIVVTCQNERSQLQNKEKALDILKSKLYLIKEAEKKAKERDIKGEHEQTAWGNQIRSYVLHPYKMVKDLRSGYETANTEAVLNGEIDKFIETNLKKR